MSFLELAKARYSCRKLTDKPIEPEKVERLLQAANQIPRSLRQAQADDKLHVRGGIGIRNRGKKGRRV